MAAQQSAQNPHQWPDGSFHSKPWMAHQMAVAAAKPQASFAPAKGQANTPLGGSGPAKGVLRPLGADAGVAASPATGTAPPVDPALQGFVAGANRDRDTRVGQLEAQKPQLLGDYGYKASGYDSTGAPTGLTFDSTNPFSKAALMLRNYNQRQAGTTNGMAAQGQLYSGALTRAKRSNERGYSAASDALIKALTRGLVGVNDQIATAKTGTESAIANAILNRAPSA